MTDRMMPNRLSGAGGSGSAPGSPFLGIVMLTELRPGFRGGTASRQSREERTRDDEPRTGQEESGVGAPRMICSGRTPIVTIDSVRIDDWLEFLTEASVMLSCDR